MPSSAAPLRFAHPFFTNVKPAQRVPDKRFGRRMTDHVKDRLQAVPKTDGDGVMTLAELIGKPGAMDIEKTGKMSFHTVGDTGRSADSPQGEVAEAMAKDFDVNHPERSPAFFYHLGDVIYGAHKDQRFRREFYEPYVHYPGKIVAIPGNHDGEVFQETDPKTLRAFRANFCASKSIVPEIAGTIFRQTVTQPGVYWRLDAPFADIVGLYSNVAENPGFISGKIPGNAQKKWLTATLQAIVKSRKQGTRKALILATHHPPFSSAGHSGSQEMLQDIDESCDTAGIMPDLFLSGHSHTYQRYTRRVTFKGQSLEIPFLVAGVGGINDQSVPNATGQVEGDHSFDHSHKGFGYLRITVERAAISVEMIGVAGAQKASVDRCKVDLTTGKLQ